MNVRLFLVDDHKVILEALSLLLEKEKGMTVVGMTTDPRVMLESIATVEADVVVLDISMPGMNGVEAARKLNAARPEIKIVALSCSSLKQHVLEMLDAGAAAYVIKENASTELVRAIQAVMKGQKYLCPEISAIVVDYFGDHDSTRRSRNKTLQPLGARECEVLRLLAEGHNSPAIAKCLFISPNTVDVHRRNIMRKLELHSVAELTKYAVRNGITPA